MGHNAGKNRCRDDETGGSPETYSRMESKKRKALTGLLIPRISRSSNNVGTPLD
jgi:hypothetical protein